MGLPFFVNLFMAMHLDLILSALINGFSFWIKPFSYFMNSVISLGVIGFYFFFIYSVIRQSINLEKTTQEYHKLKKQLKREKRLNGEVDTLAEEVKEKKQI